MHVHGGKFSAAYNYLLNLYSPRLCLSYFWAPQPMALEVRYSFSSLKLVLLMLFSLSLLLVNHSS